LLFVTPMFRLTSDDNKPEENAVFTEGLVTEGAADIPACLLAAPSSGPIPRLDHKRGTTTLSFVYNKGKDIVVAVDSRASTGQYIASGTVTKILQINDFMVGTMAGGAADCQFWNRILRRECRSWELRNKERPTIAVASKILSNILYSYRFHGLSVGTMVTGVDKHGAHLYYLDNDGSRFKNDRFSVGSGSIYAYGVLDSGIRDNLTKDEAIELGRRAIFHATFRDAGSGGFINVVHISAEKGVEWISHEDCWDLYKGKYAPDSNAMQH